MKRIAFTVIAVGLVQSLMVVLGPSAVQAGQQRSNTIRLDVENDQYAFVDVAPTGVGVGDQYVFSDNLLQDGKRVGEDGGSCQVVDVLGDVVTTNCVISLSLPGGALTIQSLWVRGASSAVMAITGGTGEYKNARGEVHITDIQTPQEKVVIRFEG